MSYFSPRNILETLTQPSFVLPTLFSLLPPYAIALLGIGASMTQMSFPSSNVSKLSAALPLAIASLPPVSAASDCATQVVEVFGISNQDPIYYLQINLLKNASFARNPARVALLYNFLDNVNKTCSNLISISLLKQATLIQSLSLDACPSDFSCSIGNYKIYSRNGVSIDRFAQYAFTCLTDQLMSPAEETCPLDPTFIIAIESTLGGLAALMILLLLYCSCYYFEKKVPVLSDSSATNALMVPLLEETKAEVAAEMTPEIPKVVIVLGKTGIQPLMTDLLDAKPGNFEL